MTIIHYHHKQNHYHQPELSEIEGAKCEAAATLVAGGYNRFYFLLREINLINLSPHQSCWQKIAGLGCPPPLEWTYAYQPISLIEDRLCDCVFGPLTSLAKVL